MLTLDVSRQPIIISIVSIGTLNNVVAHSRQKGTQKDAAMDGKKNVFYRQMELQNKKAKVKHSKLLRICFYDFLSNSAFSNATIHCLLFNITMRIRFGHFYFTD